MMQSLDRKFVLGVTGGIGSGKSAATDQFESLGITVVDADIVAREVVEPGQPALQKIVEHFGEAILDGQQLNRAKLRELVFSDTKAKEALNSIMHPAIREALINQLAEANSCYVILSAPLLFENGLEKYTNHNLVIDVPEDVQLSRASARDGVSAQQISSIMKAQLDRTTRLEKADDVVDNSGSLAELQDKICNLNDKYLILSNKTY